MIFWRSELAMEPPVAHAHVWLLNFLTADVPVACILTLKGAFLEKIWVNSSHDFIEDVLSITVLMISYRKA